jgi:Leucine-rich repeat (LRR) protein
MTTLPTTLSSLEKLEELDISHNRLTVLPDLHIEGLSVLNCVGNDLKGFPPSLSALTGLTELNAQMNLVDELPPAIGGLVSLRKLKLKKNLIREFPKEIGGMTSLEELLISDNQFINLPRTIGQLKKLTLLKGGDFDFLCGSFFIPFFFLASENAFIYLPPELGNLPSLRRLDLSFNQIESLPKEMGKSFFVLLYLFFFYWFIREFAFAADPIVGGKRPVDFAERDCGNDQFDGTESLQQPLTGCAQRIGVVTQPQTSVTFQQSYCRFTTGTGPARESGNAACGLQLTQRTQLRFV